MFALNRHTPVQLLAVLTAASLLAGCASTGTPEPEASSKQLSDAEPPPRDLAEAVARARSARAAADALKPPTYTGPRDVESLTQFMNTEFKAWTTEKNLAASKATRAYATAASLAPPETQVELRLGFAEMWLDYADEFIETGEASIPDAWQRHPSIVASYRDSLHNTTQSHIDVARIALERCVASAELHAIQSVAATRCTERLERLNRTTASNDAPPYDPNPIQSTEQPSPCVFRGTLHGQGMRLFAEPRGDDVLALIDRADVEVHLPTAGGRPRAQVYWPLEAEGYLDEYAFETTKRVDAIPPRVWLPTGTAVNAYAGSGNDALITRAFSPPGGPQHSPAEFSGSIACADLALRGPLRASGAALTRDDLLLRAGRVELYDAPEGRVIAWVTTRGETVTPVEYRRDWTRIQLRSPFEADVWVRASRLGEPSRKRMSIGVLQTQDTGRVTHIATEPVRLHLSPAPAGDGGTSLSLAPNAGFELGAARGAFVEVRPHGIERSGGAPYYARASDLKAKSVAVAAQ